MNVGMVPIVISRYTVGDKPTYDSEGIKDDVSALDAACTGTVTEDAAGGGAANIGMNDMSGTLIVTVQNIPELRTT